jgi:hypothetical protein
MAPARRRRVGVLRGKFVRRQGRLVGERGHQYPAINYWLGRKPPGEKLFELST